MDLARHIRAGDGVWWAQAGAEPLPLVTMLMEQVSAIGPVRAFVGLTLNSHLVDNLPPEISVVSYGGLGSLRELSRRGRLEVVPCHYSSLPRLFASGALPCDVGLLQVSPPDEHGMVSLGIGMEYIADAAKHTPTLLAEVNQQMPRTRGSLELPLSRFAAVLHTDRPLQESVPRPPDAVDQAIAGHVAGLVDDRDTLQIGVGTLPNAVLAALHGHRDLGVHSGMINGGVVDLIDAGVVTGRFKERDPGVVVTPTAIGTAGMYRRLVDRAIEFRPVSYTHSPVVLSSFRSLVSVNSALEVDLLGQIGAEVAAGATVGAVGGQVDFSRAASLTGKHSIIAVRSTIKGASTIRPRLASGVVTTARSDVDFVVTEHGVAHLTGRTVDERAARLLAVAAPEHRDELEQTGGL